MHTRIQLRPTEYTADFPQNQGNANNCISILSALCIVLGRRQCWTQNHVQNFEIIGKNEYDAVY